MPYKSVKNASFAIYDSNRTMIRPLSENLKEFLRGKEGHINIVLQDDKEIYGSCNNVPIRLVRIGREGENVVEVFLAQSKHIETDFTRLADLATDGFWEWYPILDYEYMSQRFWSILGYSQAEMGESPMSWQQIIDPIDRKYVMMKYQQHVESKGKISYNLIVKYRHRIGHIVHIVCKGSVEEWLPNGTPWRLIGTHTDVTDIVMKESLIIREKFVSRMSHEIRSPICAVLNECEALSNKYDFSVIKDACSQILYIANDILCLNELKSDNVSLNLEPRDPVQTLLNCIERHKVKFEKKGLKLTCSSSFNEDSPKAMIDVSKFNQIMNNLLSNSFKYTTNGVVTVDSEYDRDNSNFTVTVNDTGAGIPKDEQHKIFYEFYRGSSCVEGIGIGLYTVKVLCNSMKGSVDLVRSEIGKGTSIRFSIMAEHVLSEISKPAEKFPMIRVLVVDDISTNRILINHHLKKFKIVSEVVEACDGQEAVCQFQKSENRFDLVLMDCSMPVMDGFEATTRIHSFCMKEGMTKVPVIAVTASVSKNIREKCRKAGIIDVVYKPIIAQVLRESIEKNTYSSRPNPEIK